MLGTDGDNLKNRRTLVVELFSSVTVRLGEMNADQLGRQPMDPEIRNAIRVTIDDLACAETSSQFL